MSSKKSRNTPDRVVDAEQSGHFRINFGHRNQVEREDMKLAHYNKLPPKPECIEKVSSALRNSLGPVTERGLMKMTGLTRTQTLCALEPLVSEKLVLVIQGPRRFLWERGITDFSLLISG
jgi:hypothetical protein